MNFESKPASNNTCKYKQTSSPQSDAYEANLYDTNSGPMNTYHESVLKAIKLHNTFNTHIYFMDNNRQI